MTKKKIKFLLILSTLTLTPLTVIACKANDEEKNPTPPKVSNKPEVQLTNLYTEFVKTNQALVSALIYHDFLDYEQDYQMVFLEFDNDTKKEPRYVKSENFKFDKKQNATSDTTIFNERKTYYSEQVKNILVKDLQPDKQYLLYEIIYQKNGKDQVISRFNLEDENQLHFFQTPDTEFEISSKKISKNYDPIKKEMNISYYVDAKKLIGKNENWSYKINLEIHQKNKDQKKQIFYYLSQNEHKITNDNIEKQTIKFEVKFPLTSAEKEFEIKTANLVATWKNSNANKEEFGIQYLTPIKS